MGSRLVDIKGFEGLYAITVFGDVYSYRSGRFLTRHYNTNGYPKVVLYRKGVGKNLSIHRAVAEAFLPREKGKDYVNHKDGVKDNCYAGNLEWCTSSENTIHAYRTGLIGYINTNKNGKLSGENNVHSKLTSSQVKEIRRIGKTGVGGMWERWGISRSHFYNIISGERWKGE